MKNQKTIVVAIYFAVLAVTIVIAGLLFSQYRYFKQEAQELAQVKDAYYQHVEMLKRSLNASMVQDEEEEQEGEGEKKKVTNDKLGKQPFVTIDFTVDAEPEEAPSEFQIISQEEEDLLNAIKSNIKKLRAVPVVKHKKVAKKAFYKSLKKPTRYAPQRDFVFRWPVELSNFWLSSLFGPRKRPNGHIEFHQGIDMAAMRGTPVKAAAGGKVIFAQAAPGYGNCIMIEHNNRYKTRYGHLHRICVRPGQVVQEGERIGTVGDTGLVRKSGRDASHLHFEIHQEGRRVNPLIFLF
ncbi:MAG: M23 family metallopeptidase [Candidatus Dependentiae bacterium]|nr:M23 family metallopeptidase [Candidatus Dependentiae bacterium]